MKGLVRRGFRFGKSTSERIVSFDLSQDSKTRLAEVADEELDLPRVLILLPYGLSCSHPISLAQAYGLHFVAFRQIPKPINSVNLFNESHDALWNKFLPASVLHHFRPDLR